MMGPQAPPATTQHCPLRSVMRRRLLILLQGLITTLGAAIPAHADPGVIKDVFIEDFQGTTPWTTPPSPTA
jgi:hypothetical protein